MWAAVLLDAALMNGNHSGHSEPRGIFLHVVSWKAVQLIQRRSLRQEFPAEYGQIEQHSTRKASARNYITMQMNEIVNTFKNVLKKDNDDIADL